MTAPAVTRRRPEPSPAVVALGTRRRTTELGLLVLAVLIILGAYALASLGRNASLPADIWPFLAVLLALLVGAHLANRRLARAADSLLLPLAALLNGIGYVFIARLDQDLAALQASWTAVGIVAYVVTLLAVRDVRLLQRYRYTAGLIGVLLLILPLLPGIGRSINGARIWVSVGPVSFQPGEFAKIAFAVFFAGYLVERRELLSVATFRVGPFNTPDPKHFAPILLAWGASLVVLIFQRDLGSALLFFLLFVVMLWVATGRVSYLLVGMGLFLVGAFVSWLSFEHVQKRVLGVDRPVGRPAGIRLPDHPGRLRARVGRNLRGRARVGHRRADPLRRDRLHLRDHRRGARPARHDRHPVRLPAAGRHRTPGGPRVAGPVPVAAGGGAHRADRVPGLHHHGWRHPTAAPHRGDPAVRLLRRQLPGGQLRAAGAPGSDLGPDGASRPGAGGGDVSGVRR
ncbi:MAG: FtsW/RodA/SpoVE family cell cycle protein [Microthrixaceae bacterium]